ncbi:MAG: phosphoribosylaminoimidazolesuccinocarboxamide synthase [Alphaproteobacteria bacterium]|nr:phosphoribosylaminoimidazolesuccinocarboxamide synthase [Alphaproteobacteria bacterium]MCB1551398.1 phosphoribosylaminoimidazolesuccinocarboxamide synthase [Alphaproteobacteria bacterium]MCB9984289.1 phosphoribosylaminoimidazolesuccinocarboxamide synthase [Micavibrio sp.]HPQ50442.1 phosphoribosylaminoimidazolesuccinocarboxamide synthase [Alphaproteobacteria bacterium]HRK97133.1 phosphoribosylaminoimidazolesuccinocarboxamide synthase [Alphaproteobacteria bacterium]
MNRRKVIYEGKAKTIFEGPEPGTVIQYFKDDATSGKDGKHDIIAGKGVLNNRISAHIMTKLEGMGIPTHFLKCLNMREQLIRQVEIIPLKVVVRNVAAGSLVQKLGMKEGQVLNYPLVEFYYKKDELNDPMVSENHILNMGWADPYELEEIVSLAWRINDYLSGLFSGIGIRLIDFKLEFGRIYGEYEEVYILLADEISPDNCRLWDEKTNKKLDKDRFRQDLGGVIEAYQDIAKRLGLVPDSGIIQGGNIDEQIAATLGEIENELARERKLRSINKSAPTKPWK